MTEDAAHRSVPRWPSESPGVDESGTSFAIVTFGPDAVPVGEAWRVRVRALRRPCFAAHAEADSGGGARGADDVLRALAGEVRAARVGWRLMAAGPEADVLRARAVALDGGAVGGEVTALVTDDRRRRVWCAHCGSTTEDDVRPGGSVRCSGCGRALVVHAHVSRRRAAYLGSLG